MTTHANHRRASRRMPTATKLLLLAALATAAYFITFAVEPDQAATSKEAKR